MTGVTIGGYHSYDDLKMILASREIGLPEPQTTSIEIIGRSGKLDLTEALSSEDGEIHYNNRTLKLTFVTLETISGENWLEFLSGLAAKFHGPNVKVIFDEAPDYYFTGRCSINSFETDCVRQKVVLSIDCDPYQYAVEGSTRILTLASGDTEEVTLSNSGTTQAIPTIIVESEDSGDDTPSILFSYSGGSTALGEGTYKLTGFVLSAGEEEEVTVINQSEEAEVTVTITIQARRI